MTNLSANMPRRIGKTLPFALFIAALLFSVMAEAHVATLDEPEQGGTLAPEGSVEISVSSDIKADQIKNLFVEFDGYDVTDMVTVEDNTITFTPADRLNPGDYPLRLLQKIGNAKPVEVENWTLRVQGGGLKEGSVEGTLDVQDNFLAANNQEGSRTDSLNEIQTNLNTVAKAGGDGWDTSLKVNSSYDTVAKNNPGNNNFVLGNYLATARSFTENVNTTLNIGDHDTGTSNLLMSDFNRRGVSGAAQLFNRVDVTAFSQDPSQGTGIQNASGFGQDNDRVSGAFAKIYSYPDNHRDFIETGYYGGAGTQQGSATAVADNAENSGSGWMMGAEGQTVDDKINLRGDYARAGFNADSTGASGNDVFDNAERVRLTVAPVGTLKSFDPQEGQWKITVLTQSVGTFFKSLVNTNLPQDENRIDVSSNYQHQTFSLTGQTYTTTNNVDDNPALPSDRTYGFVGQAGFTPHDVDKSLLPENWFTYSTFSVGSSYTDQLREKTPDGFSGLGLNQGTWTANAAWTAPIGKSSMSLTDTYSDFQDNITASNSYTDNVSAISWGYAPSEDFHVTPSVQFDDQNRDDGNSNKQYLFSLDTSETLIPDKLTHQFHYSATVASSATAQDQHILTTTFTWQLEPAETNKPGVSLALSGDYQDLSAPVVVSTTPSIPGTITGEQYKIYLQLKISTPFSF